MMHNTFEIAVFEALTESREINLIVVWPEDCEAASQAGLDPDIVLGPGCIE